MSDLSLILSAFPGATSASVNKRRWLVDTLRGAVLEGRLSPGALLPASRTLAVELGLGRNTVVGAYEQLCVEGYLIASRQGTRVGSGLLSARTSRVLATVARTHNLAPALSRRADVDLAVDVAGAEALRPFLPGVPALDHFPLRRWRRYVTAAWNRLSIAGLGGRPPLGEMDLRAAVAAHLRSSRGVRGTPEQIQLTSGTQESLLLCAHMLADPGDRVWVDNPGYAGARAAFSAAGLRLVGIPVDDQGLAPPVQAWQRMPPRLIYTTPAHQYPTGVVMTLARRATLLRNAASGGAWILEDDYDSELCQGVPLAAMQGTVPQAPVVYLGTFSKTLYPALRLGFIVWPESILKDVSARLAQIQTGGRTAEQCALAAFIQDGHFAIHVRHMRSLYARRQQALRAALTHQWPWPLSVSGGQAGMHLAISLPAGMQDAEVVAQARQRGLGAQALSAGYLAGSGGVHGLVLGYANLTEDRVAGHVATLIEAVTAARQARGAESGAQ